MGSGMEESRTALEEAVCRGSAGKSMAKSEDWLHSAAGVRYLTRGQMSTLYGSSQRARKPSLAGPAARPGEPPAGSGSASAPRQRWTSLCTEVCVGGWSWFRAEHAQYARRPWWAKREREEARFARCLPFILRHGAKGHEIVDHALTRRISQTPYRSHVCSLTYRFDGG